MASYAVLGKSSSPNRISVGGPSESVPIVAPCLSSWGEEEITEREKREKELGGYGRGETKEDQINGEIVMEEAKEGQMNGAIVIEKWANSLCQAATLPLPMPLKGW
ncbi:hypothetical protein LOK49_Contig80G00002 [Camellia lanceoleosa]|nr:hypothetical protein LOK49_Contig80G00002 [Camellia lanceoleosa]